MPTKQRMALTLYYLGDEKQTYHEIGEVLGINEETARSQVRYAKNKIKTKIEELRAQGKSFYTVAPLPFLAWMLNDELNKVKVPDTLIESVKAATISPIATPPKITGRSNKISCHKQSSNIECKCRCESWFIKSCDWCINCSRRYRCFCG